MQVNTSKEELGKHRNQTAAAVSAGGGSAKLAQRIRTCCMVGGSEGGRGSYTPERGENSPPGFSCVRPHRQQRRAEKQEYSHSEHRGGSCPPLRKQQLKEQPQPEQHRDQGANTLYLTGGGADPRTSVDQV